DVELDTTFVLYSYRASTNSDRLDAKLRLFEDRLPGVVSVLFNDVHRDGPRLSMQRQTAPDIPGTRACRFHRAGSKNDLRITLRVQHFGTQHGALNLSP